MTLSTDALFEVRDVQKVTAEQLKYFHKYVVLCKMLYVSKRVRQE